MIQHILFDLDNTLYSPRYGLEEDMGRRVTAYTAAYLKTSPEEALRRRRECVHAYGTTLEWLMAEEGLCDVEGYYAAIHPAGEEQALTPDPDLRLFLQSLPCPLAILTNSPREHTDRILNRLGIPDLFTHIFDMRFNGLKGKPRKEVFYRALGVLNAEPENVLFIDDSPTHVESYRALGGRGLLIDYEDDYPDYPHPRIREISGLTEFLN
jgi:putative hydrolase of the HAD superfamily